MWTHSCDNSELWWIVSCDKITEVQLKWFGDTEQLNKALDMMNNAVAGGHSQPGARENVAYLASTERRRDFESLPSSAVSSQEVCYTSIFNVY